jgi:hypothetical protein
MQTRIRHIAAALALFAALLLPSLALADCTTPAGFKRIGGSSWRMGNVAFPTAPGVERLPSSVPSDIPQAIKDLGRLSTGRTAHIETDAATLRLCWDNATGGSSTFKWSQNGMRGIDVYWREAGTAEWHWLGQGDAISPDSNIVTFNMGSSAEREFLIYFPSYARLTLLRVEVPTAATVTPGPAPSEKWAILGTSLTQCGNTSRPGQCYPAILSREMNVDIANLGFSGSCKMYAGLETLLTASVSDAFIIDCLGNMTLTDISTQMFDFLDALAENNPGVPIYVVEQTHEYQGFADNSVYDAETAAAKAVFDSVDALHDNVFWLHAPELTGDDTVDGRHFNDAGNGKAADSLKTQIDAL